MQSQGHFVETIQLAEHVRSALISSVMGLIVALAVQLFYFILAEQIGKIVLDMEKSASEMIYFLAARKFTPAHQGAVSALTATPTEESAIDNATISDEMDDDKQKDL